MWHDIASQQRLCESMQSKKSIKIAEKITHNHKVIFKTAANWIEDLRANKKDNMQSFFAELDLSSSEGVGLMCLAEALIRIPDKETANKFIAEKLNANASINDLQKQGVFATAAYWGMLFGAKITADTNKVWQTMLKKLGTPVVRTVVLQVMAKLGEHFVMGETITQAQNRARKSKKNYLYSYDMLGEAAITQTDAKYYFEKYKNAIIALKNNQANLFANDGISVKLSALNPRFETTNADECVPDLVKKVSELIKLAKKSNISLTLDAEEADRLGIFLTIFEEAFKTNEVYKWGGFGIAVQAYNKASIAVIEAIINLAKDKKTKIPIRLVKGAYWDYEIKASQTNGINFPVWTRKAMTDTNYLACAGIMLDANEYIYAQFATHNAHTVAAILNYGKDKIFEFQCLHGMGEMLYDHIKCKQKCRIYAPVGPHKALLPYLVRRLLENGANSSFVHQLVNPQIKLEKLLSCPVSKVMALEQVENPHISNYKNLFSDRKNSQGIDLNDLCNLQKMQKIINNPFNTIEIGLQPNKTINGPIERNIPVSNITLANPNQVEKAVQDAEIAYKTWHCLPVIERAQILIKAADLLSENYMKFIILCIRESGKTWSDANDEIREAVDFLRYYASQAISTLQDKICPGPTGETNTWRPIGRGVVLCLSPWNFPLAIFIGQVSAALVAGNTVLAKPASQTATIANEMLKIMYQAGLPKNVCHLLPGGHQVVGTPLVNDKRIKAVMLTGSTNTAQKIATNLAKRNNAIVPLIAETGGQNAMIVDSTALPEQVVIDLIESAFKSAGQRCSACRVVFLQDTIADSIIELLIGAMKCLKIGDPLSFSTDIGPVIDENAKNQLEDHVKYLNKINASHITTCQLDKNLPKGSFFAPRVYEINNLSLLKNEVFGPILHIIRYSANNLDDVMKQIHATEYGLTLGLHSRRTDYLEKLSKQFDVGNIYINRNMIGAVVGVQPFGGNNLSGTGPKAGGPWYLTRLCKEQVISVNTAAIGGNASLLSMSDE